MTEAMSTSAAARTDDAAAADFTRRFAEYWQEPSPDRLDMVLAERVHLDAPLMPVTHTLTAGRRAFAGLLRLIPDLTGEVHRWGATEDGVMIEFTLSGTLGGKPISWDAVDRFILGENGRASERITYFDPVPIVLAAVRRPRAWPALLRSRGPR